MNHLDLDAMMPGSGENLLVLWQGLNERRKDNIEHKVLHTESTQ